MDKLTIAVVFGGQSGEHEVSLVSAHAVMNALDSAKYRLLPIGITKSGHWIAGHDAMSRLVAAADPKRLPTSVDWRATPAVEVVQHSTSALSVDTSGWHPNQFFKAFQVDVIFPVLHGPMGEDGTVQGLFELAGVPYIGCGVAASAISLDKALMKAAFAAADLPLLPWLLVHRSDWQRTPGQTCATIEENLGYPVFVKPANMGSSVGVNKATDRASLEHALAEAASYDRRIVVEQGIAAREIEVSVLGNDAPEASIAGEIVPADEWYTYEAKYISGKSELIIPASLEQTLAEQVRTLAVRAFTAVDGAGLARVDFLLDNVSGTLWLNEVNTMPGFTSVSMYAKLWAATGLEYGALLDRLIELAQMRAVEQQHMRQYT